MKMQQPNGSRPAGTAGRHHSWPLRALLAVGGWLVVSPLVLSTTRVTAGVVSAVAGGLAVLAGWALAARNRIPPLAIACFFGLWLVLVPSLWEFRDGVDSGPGLVPLTPAAVTEPAGAVVARAEWNSILVGLVIVLLAGSALLAGLRQGRPAAGGGDDQRHADAERRCPRAPSPPAGRRRDLALRHHPAPGGATGPGGRVRPAGAGGLHPAGDRGPRRARPGARRRARPPGAGAAVGRRGGRRGRRGRGRLAGLRRRPPRGGAAAGPHPAPAGANTPTPLRSPPPGRTRGAGRPLRAVSWPARGRPRRRCATGG